MKDIGNMYGAGGATVALRREHATSSAIFRAIQCERPSRYCVGMVHVHLLDGQQPDQHVRTARWAKLCAFHGQIQPWWGESEAETEKRTKQAKRLLDRRTSKGGRSRPFVGSILKD